MTISLCTVNHATCERRLTFGVPLEDVFPNGDVHPSLKRLFDETYRAFRLTDRPLARLTRPSPKHARLIDDLKHNRTITAEMFSFETLMSTLRHYLAALPLPLMPKFTNREYYQWLELAGDCKHALRSRLHDFRKNRSVVKQMAQDLIRLPRVNLLLIGYFINFLRSLINRGRRLNMKAANVLINYFSSSIFCNSLQGYGSDNERNVYHPLMLFMILKWPHIQYQCMELQPQCFRAHRANYAMLRQQGRSFGSSLCTHRRHTPTSQVRSATSKNFEFLDTISEELTMNTIYSQEQLPAKEQNNCSSQTSAFEGVSVQCQTELVKKKRKTAIDPSPVLKDEKQSIGDSPASLVPKSTPRSGKNVDNVISSEKLSKIAEYTELLNHCEAAGKSTSSVEDRQPPLELFGSNDAEVPKGVIRLPSCENLTNSESIEENNDRCRITQSSCSPGGSKPKKTTSVFGINLGRFRFGVDFVRLFKNHRNVLMGRVRSEEIFGNPVKYEKLSSCQKNYNTF